MKALDIDSQPCLIHTTGTPKAVLIQLTARHERKTIDSELSLIEQGSQMGFVFVGIDLQQWHSPSCPGPTRRWRETPRWGVTP